MEITSGGPSALMFSLLRDAGQNINTFRETDEQGVRAHRKSRVEVGRNRGEDNHRKDRGTAKLSHKLSHKLSRKLASNTGGLAALRGSGPAVSVSNVIVSQESPAASRALDNSQQAPASKHKGHPAAKQNDSPAAKQTGSPAANQNGNPAAKQNDSPAAKQNGNPAAKQNGAGQANNNSQANNGKTQPKGPAVVNNKGGRPGASLGHGSAAKGGQGLKLGITKVRSANHALGHGHENNLKSAVSEASDRLKSAAREASDGRHEATKALLKRFREVPVERASLDTNAGPKLAEAFANNAKGIANYAVSKLDTATTTNNPSERIVEALVNVLDGGKPRGTEKATIDFSV